jgi:ribonuclease P protein subunit POP4
MITPRNISRHEMIGLEVEISESRDPTLKNLKGRIIDETKNTFTIQVNEKKKKIPKGICKFRFRLKDANVEVSGHGIIGRPQERIKK